MEMSSIRGVIKFDRASDTKSCIVSGLRHRGPIDQMCEYLALLTYSRLRSNKLTVPMVAAPFLDVLNYTVATSHDA